MRNIRKKMIDIISREVTTTDLKDVVNKLIPDSIARDIEKACQGERRHQQVDLEDDDDLTVCGENLIHLICTSG